MKKLQCNKMNHNIFWLKEESLEDMENLPDPNTITKELSENLEYALEQPRSLYEAFKK
ncbi:MAG: hypothetical protein ABIL40_11190 [candidate division WOR-3 bacterium]